MTPPAQSPGACESFAAGHNVHFIQVLHAANRPEMRALTVDAQLVSLDGQALTLALENGDQVVLQNHEPDDIRAACGSLPADVTWNARYSLLKVGSSCFSVAEQLALVRCVRTPAQGRTVDGLVKVAETHGGFGVVVDGEPSGSDSG